MTHWKTCQKALLHKNGCDCRTDAQTNPSCLWNDYITGGWDFYINRRGVVSHINTATSPSVSPYYVIEWAILHQLRISYFHADLPSEHKILGKRAQCCVGHLWKSDRAALGENAWRWNVKCEELSPSCWFGSERERTSDSRRRRASLQRVAERRGAQERAGAHRSAQVGCHPINTSMFL